MKLEKMKQVELREVWKHEALQFTQWMAKPENIEYLNNVIGLSLVDIMPEKSVSSYKCDIYARDEFTNKKVIIENQLEKTDHDHLGKIITYASGLDADVIIWIVKQVRPEHSSAIEWLNKHTDEDISFFLIEAKLWKIGDSAPALQLVIIEAPNDFNKSLKRSATKKTLSTSDLKRIEFWESFNEVMSIRQEFNLRKPSVDRWYNFSIGTSRCYLQVNLINTEKRIRVSMHIPDDKDMYDVFADNKEEIEKKIGLELEWERQDNIKQSKIFTYVSGFHMSKPESFELVSNKTIDMLVEFRDAFKPYINN